MQSVAAPPTARAAALAAVRAVLVDGESLSIALPKATAGLADPRDRALADELAYGVLRGLPRLEAVLAQVLERPLRPQEVIVRVALLLGAYQLLSTRVPPYAAVAETLALLEAAGRAWAKGLANAVLRRVDRERAALLAGADATEPGRWAHPAWLIDAVRRAWPQDWQAVLTANNAHPPLTLRVNARRGTREAYLARLAEAGLAARPAPHTTHGVVLETAAGVERLPGFAEGLCSVQDAAAQLAAPLLAPAPGDRVLDACAAPGGKTAHLLEMQPDLGELVAVEQDPRRAERLAETLRRLGLRATTRVADAADPGDWWDGRPFDRILIDAPCSATGVIRRHPDVKARRTPDQLATLAAGQTRLLAALWPLLAPGGVLLYATCSIFPEENEQPLARFLAVHTDARPVPLDVPWGRARAAGRQVLPGDDGMDGFFYALVRRKD
ncbi:MAG: 16S rRNA (cytosine(967)-C(5))-methyltransferase RsmB [Gammaproteobacteria bacterium]|nr:16S rRNA (cytosine(967)-C(5))-methyltransferase RsmB [Gammaproteobacteria bacterium]